MNNNQKPRHSQLSRQILLQYLLSIAGTGILYILLVFLLWLISRSFVWQPWDPLYQLLQWVKDNFILVFTGTLIVIWAVITYLFIKRPLRYLDRMIEAAKQLAAPNEQEILLPKAMKTVQDEMNLVREQALRNAYAAREAEQRKNDLIVYLAHDLKTPLTSVIGYLNLLQDEPQISPELRARYTGIALDKALRLEELINDFFDITRFNLTTLTLEPERINFSRMLEQVTCEFEPILAEKGLEWETVIQPDISILCDPDKIERVLDNLIRNAVNYSYPDSKIFLSMYSLGEQIEIDLKNKGKTIPPEKLSRIFEQFYRLDSSRSSKTGGSGLGLAIAKEIVTLHGGSIRAESENESVCFQVVLPKIVRKSYEFPHKKVISPL